MHIEESRNVSGLSATPEAGGPVVPANSVDGEDSCNGSEEDEGDDDDLPLPIVGAQSEGTKVDVQSAKYHETITIRVDPGQTLIRIDQFLLDRLQAVSRNKIQSGIHEGLVKVNDQFVKPNYRVKPGDVIVIVLEKSAAGGEILPEDIPLDIRYEDEDVAVLFKPAEFVVHPGVGNHSGTLVNALAFHFRNLPRAEGNEDQVGLVHRIDKNTTGLW
jgi:23S rRNA pseudouridine1911/1915/1917 synthase